MYYPMLYMFKISQSLESHKANSQCFEFCPSLSTCCCFDTFVVFISLNDWIFATGQIKRIMKKGVKAYIKLRSLEWVSLLTT